MLNLKNKGVGRFRSQEGISLIMALIAVAVTSLALTGGLRLLNQLQRGTNFVQKQASRDQTLKRIQEALSNPTAIQESFTLASADTSDPFYRCISDTETATDCVNDARADFILTDVTGSPLSGTQSAVVRYDASGNTCDTPSTFCFLEAFTEFEGLCASGAPNCQRALNLRLLYTLRKAPSLESNPDVPAFAPKTGEFVFAIRNLASLGSQSCAANQTNTGVDEFGNLVCVDNSASLCGANEFVSGVDANGDVTCASRSASSCPAGQYVSGINASGNVICAALPSSSFSPSNCPSGQVGVGINSSGQIICSAPS